MSRHSNLTYIKSFLVEVVTSGTPVQATEYVVPDGIEVLITATGPTATIAGNSGTVTVASTSDEADHTETSNKPLEPGQSVGYQIRNTQNLWLDSSVSGDTATVSFEYSLTE